MPGEFDKARIAQEWRVYLCFGELRPERTNCILDFSFLALFSITDYRELIQAVHSE
jgi:hypothetical protein